MKSEHILKHIKIVLWGIAVAFIAQIMLTANAHAQVTTTGAGSTPGAIVSTDAQLNALTATLNQVAAAINAATNLTPDERLNLYTQLVQVSRAILALQSSSGVTVAPAPVQQPQYVTLDSLGLHRVVAKFDPASPVVTVDEYYIGANDDVVGDPFGVQYSVVSNSITINQPATNLTFAEQVVSAKDQVATQLSQTHNVDPVKMGGITYMTARNPLRDDPAASVRQNSSAADALAADFGLRSVVTMVEIFPGDRYAKVLLHSDQGEQLELEIIRDDLGYTASAQPTGQTVPANDQYSYVYSQYVPMASDPAGTAPTPKVTSIQTGLSEQELLNFLNGLFTQIPFTSKLRQADQRLLFFLTQNTDQQTSPCVDRADEVVVSEYALQLLGGLRVQYILDSALVQYAVIGQQAPSGAPTHCAAAQRYF